MTSGYEQGSSGYAEGKTRVGFDIFPSKRTRHPSSKNCLICPCVPRAWFIYDLSLPPQNTFLPPHAKLDLLQPHESLCVVLIISSDPCVMITSGSPKTQCGLNKKAEYMWRIFSSKNWRLVEPYPGKLTGRGCNWQWRPGLWNSAPTICSLVHSCVLGWMQHLSLIDSWLQHPTETGI